MKTIDYNNLTIAANRQRKEFEPEALTDLANSISKIGLLHPIVVRESAGGYTLVAGERRLKALDTLWLLGESIKFNNELLPPYKIPILTLGELDPLSAEEAELDENLKRRDLTWQERSEALARLHALRQKQAEAINQTHTIAKTLAEVESADYQLDRRAILVASHLSKPEVAKAKSVDEAFKILKRDEDRKKNEALAATVGQNFNSSVHKLFHTDCLEWLQSCPENTFDVILTDPPYGMGADTFGDGAGKLANSTHIYDDSLESWERLMADFCPLIFTRSKPEAHAYIFCDIDRFHQLKALMEGAGWYVFRTPLINYKPGSGRVPLPEHGPRRQYEILLYAIKGKKPVTGIFSDVISSRLEESSTHGAVKPVELYVDLLRRSIRPGDHVLDAFAGSGTIFKAAHQCRVYATGLELNPEYYGMCVNVLNSLDQEPALI